LAPVAIGTPAGEQLAVLGSGVNMPLIPVVETEMVPSAPNVVTTPLLIPVAQAAYVAPVYPRKQDRN
jgi:hypothetical protein